MNYLHMHLMLVSHLNILYRKSHYFPIAVVLPLFDYEMNVFSLLTVICGLSIHAWCKKGYGIIF